ncbi:DUF4350 domain-containing protein [Ferviditalea candida]|uniref:DUF4350 domain-containing protein n=1 Tax=Ferviditalea candida TaxID=3108399 RepID=A0ABU5ZNJ6_9BACL|nr:DUF4350 domain-containing protein [Paenibacillaceae bacterium T2]
MPMPNRLLAALVAAVLLFLIAGSLLVKPKPRKYPPYLSFSPDLHGVKVMFLLLKEKQRPAKGWEQSWRFLPAGGDQAIVVIEPLGMQDWESDWIVKWAEQGNDVILFDRDPRQFKPLRLSVTNEKNAKSGPKKIMAHMPSWRSASQRGRYQGTVSTDNRLTGIPQGKLSPPTIRVY